MVGASRNDVSLNASTPRVCGSFNPNIASLAAGLGPKSTDRQLDDNQRSLTQDTLYLKAASVKIHQRLNQRHSKAGATISARQDGFGLPEGFAHPRDIAGIDADPAVRDGQRDILTGMDAAQCHPSALGRELQSIGQDVENDL